MADGHSSLSPQRTEVASVEEDRWKDGRSLLDLEGHQAPVILRGLVDHWPLVQSAKSSHQELLAYLRRFDRNLRVPVTVGSPELDGRIFYNDDFSGPNAPRGEAPLGEVLERLSKHASSARPPLIYMASVDTEQCFPGLRLENDLDLQDRAAIVSVWMGLRTRIAAHNDLPLNIACVAAGRRRFTLFPPDQTPNLYVGPFEWTPAGRPISLVDLNNPDFERFPRFADALETALVADLEPGDALFIPSMWWHHVEAFQGINILINYWWRTVPSYLGTPQDVLNHAMMTLRELPEGERKIWRDLFEHYVFAASSETTAHVPNHIKGILGPIDEETARRTRSYLLSRLNR